MSSDVALTTAATKEGSTAAVPMERHLLLDASNHPELSSQGISDVCNPTTLEDSEGNVHIWFRAVKMPQNYSVIWHAKQNGHGPMPDEHPALTPDPRGPDRQGVEDPRITYIPGQGAYLLYTAFDGLNARIALATSKDLVNFRKRGVISPSVKLKDAVSILEQKINSGKGDTGLLESYARWWKNDLQGRSEYEKDNLMIWAKNGVLWPQKINGQYLMLVRFLPHIQYVYFKSPKDLMKDEFWTDFFSKIDDNTLIRSDSRSSWKASHVGAGAAPILTDKGWLLFYHGANGNSEGRMYSAGAALLNLEHPHRVMAENHLFSPELDFEMKGTLGNVVFPSGAYRERGNGVVKVHYGAADSTIGVATMKLEDVLELLGRQYIH